MMNMKEIIKPVVWQCCRVYPSNQMHKKIEYHLWCSMTLKVIEPVEGNVFNCDWTGLRIKL